MPSAILMEISSQKSGLRLGAVDVVVSGGTRPSDVKGRRRGLWKPLPPEPMRLPIPNLICCHGDRLPPTINIRNHLHPPLIIPSSFPATDFDRPSLPQVCICSRCTSLDCDFASPLFFILLFFTPFGRSPRPFARHGVCSRQLGSSFRAHHRQ
jgi:hypothetical protein